MVENPVQELTVEEAWEQLAAVQLGRIALSVNGRPDIYPVNFYAGEGSIVFRSGEGTKLVAEITGRRFLFGPEPERYPV